MDGDHAMIARIALFLTAALAFAANPIADRLDAVIGSLMLVAVGIGLSLAASASISAVTAAAGAVGAFAGGVLYATSPAVAGAALVGLCYAERTLRVRTPVARAVHVGLALLVGALAGALAAHYAAAAIAVRVVVAVVSAVLVALPTLVEADNPMAYALEGLAERVGDGAAEAMTNGAELRRSVDERMLDDESRKHARETWRSLLRLSQARARLERAGSPKRVRGAAVVERIDERLAEHVTALER
ncbi:MAG TPA: hypothetical protein ENK57_18640, partial [Polyangiaceae bacterium]|nr:hypothetical protein [Polyangiaceae bacterium]